MFAKQLSNIRLDAIPLVPLGQQPKGDKGVEKDGEATRTRLDSCGQNVDRRRRIAKHGEEVELGSGRNNASGLKSPCRFQKLGRRP